MSKAAYFNMTDNYCSVTPCRQTLPSPHCPLPIDGGSRTAPGPGVPQVVYNNRSKQDNGASQTPPQHPEHEGLV